MAGAKFESLLRGIEAIYADLGDPGPDEPVLRGPQEYGPPVDPAAQAEVDAVLRMLGRIERMCRGASRLPPPPPVAMQGVIGGADLLMRSDFLVGLGADLPARLPAFVYLTTLVFLDRPEAERRTREVEALVEAEGFRAG